MPTGSVIARNEPVSVTDAMIVQRLHDLYLMSRDSKGKMQQEWQRNYRIAKNRAAPSVQSAPGIRANEAGPTVDSRIGWMTDQEVIFTVTPASDPFSLWSLTQDVLAENLESVLNSNFRTEGWYVEVVQALWDSALYGLGCLKCVWDAGLDEGMGNVALKRTSPWCLYVDPYATNFDDANWIIEVHTMTWAEIERRYPSASRHDTMAATMQGETSGDHVAPSQQNEAVKRGSGLIPVGSGPVVPPTTWGAPGNAQRHVAAGAQGVNVYECWIRQNYEEWVDSADPTVGRERVVSDEWRVIVHAGGRVLMDEMAENLFHANVHPYVRYVDMETGELWGDPIMRDIGPCQVAMNTLLAMAQNNIIFTGNPMMAGTKGSGADRATIMNRPGQIFDVNPTPSGSGTNDPRWINPPQLPQLLPQMITFWRDEIERISGLSSAQRGEVPSGRATDKQVQASQEAGFVRIRSALRNLEVTLRKAGELLANLIVINYDTQRFVAIVGEEGTQTSIKLSADHFLMPKLDPSTGRYDSVPLRFSLTVNCGSAKPTARAARIAEARQLKEMNVVDDQYVLQAYRVSHWQSILQRKAQAQLQQMQLEQQFGKTQDKSRTPRPKSDIARPQ